MSESDSELVDRFEAICVDGDDVKALEALAEEVGVKTLINARDIAFRKLTCLHYATHHDRPKLSRQLIVWGADVEAKDEDGWTSLYSAQSRETVQLLVQEGGAKVNVLDNNGHSPLSFNGEYLEATEALLEEGALVKFGQYSPLRCAARFVRVDTLKVLLTQRGFVRVIQWKDDYYKKTAREVVVSHGYGDIVALLDEALVVAKVWERRLPVVRVGLAAVDTRVARLERGGGGGKEKKKVKKE